LQRVETAVTDVGTMSTRQEWFDVLGDLFELPLADISPDQAEALWNRVHSTHEAWLATQQSAP
jgi:N-hydroxyarylamine O-acetyltransferase